MDCRICRHWHDGNLLGNDAAKVAYGCAVFGEGVLRPDAENCERFSASEETFIPCRVCGIPVPRVCVLFGECVNCTDSDWHCLEACGGGKWQTFCTHWNRLRLEGKEVATPEGVQVVFAPKPSEKKADEGVSIKAIYEAELQRRKAAQHRRPRRR